MNFVVPKMLDLLRMVNNQLLRTNADPKRLRYWSHLAAVAQGLSQCSGLTEERVQGIYDTGILCAIQIDRGENHRPRLLTLQTVLHDCEYPKGETP